MEKIRNFFDLNAWQKARSLAVLVYKLTDKYPDKEIFGMTSQMRRAAVSISSNIAEGFSRKGKNEKVQFYHHSLGSITELQSQAIISKDVGYLTSEGAKRIFENCTNVQKLVKGLLKGVDKLHNT